MKELIRNEEELRDFFFGITNLPNSLRVRPAYNTVNVGTKVRREVMLSNDQGRIVMDGRVKQIVFKSLGGGVWNASLETTTSKVNEEGD